MQADICLMFKKRCKSHTYSPVTSKGVEVKALDSDIKCGGDLS